MITVPSRGKYRGVYRGVYRGILLVASVVVGLASMCLASVAQTRVVLCTPRTDSSSGVAIQTCPDVSSANALPVTGGGGGAGGGGFTPSGTGATLNPTPVSSSVGLPGNGGTVVVYNTGANDAFLKFGTGTPTATATGDLIKAGQSIAYTVGANTALAAISPGGSTSLVITGGSGGFAGVGGGGGAGGSVSPGFLPTPGYATLSPTTATSRVGLPAGTQILVYNTGTNAVYVALGNGLVVASLTAGDVIQPGGWTEFTVGGSTFLAAITAAGTSTIVISGGTGQANGAGGGGTAGGGPITAADGAIVGIGTLADAVWVSGNGSLIAIGKAIVNAVKGTLTITGSVSITGTPTITGSVSITGTPTVNQGAPGSAANGWPTKLTDGVNTAVLKAPSTPPTPADIAQVVGTPDGYAVTTGALADAAWVSGNGTLVALGKATVGAVKALGPITGPLGHGTADAAAVSIVPSATAVFPAVASASGGASPFHGLSAATNNSTNVKASAGTLYSLFVVNTTATLYYLRIYDLAAAPTCSSSVGVTHNIPIPASVTGAGIAIPMPAPGEVYANGIGYCLTAGAADNDNTNAATGVAINGSFK